MTSPFVFPRSHRKNFVWGDPSPVRHTPEHEQEESLPTALSRIVHCAQELLAADLLVLWDSRESGFGAPRMSAQERQDLLTELLAEGRSFFVRSFSDKLSGLREEGMVSLAGAPLFLDGKPRGLLLAYYREPQAFGPGQMERIESLASKIALEVFFLKLREDSRRRTARLAALTETGVRLSSAANLEVDQILQFVYEEAGRILPAENLYILLYDEDSDTYTLPFIRGQEKVSLQLTSVELRRSLGAYVVRTRNPQLITAERYRALISTGEVLILGLPAKIWLGAPMIARSKVLGVIAVQDYENEHAYDSDDLNWLMTLASQAAIAIDNAHLLQRLRSQRVSEEILTRFQDLRSALRDLLREMVHALESDGGVVFLRDREHDKIRVAVTHEWPELENRRLTQGQALAGKVAQDGRPHYINNYPKWPHKAPFFEGEENKNKIGSAIGVPINAHGELLGVVCLTSRPERERRYNPQDVHRLLRFAGPHGPVVAAVGLARRISFQRALIDNSPYPVIGANTSGRLILFNAAATKLTGYEQEEVLDKRAEVIYWRGFLETVWIQHELQEQGKAVQIESAVRSKSGEKIPVLLSAAFLTDDQGSLLGSVTVLEDLRLGALRGKNRDLLSAIDQIDRAPYDLGGLSDVIVGEAMKLFEAKAGILYVAVGANFQARSNRYAPAKGLSDLTIGRRVPLVREVLRHKSPLPLGPESGKGAPSLLPQDGGERLLIPIVDDSEVHGLLLLEKAHQDQFRFEPEFLGVFAGRCAAALRRARIEEALIRSGGAIAKTPAGTIHEIKNALSSLYWNIRDTKNALQSASGKKRASKKLAVVNSEIERLTTLVERLRDFSNPLEPQKSVELLNEIVLRAVEALESLIHSKGVETELFLDPSLGAAVGEVPGSTILVDRDQISQVIINLTLNALDASQKGGKITFRTQMHREFAELQVTDRGRGLTMAEVSDLFKPFLSSKPEGSGLGLAISKFIVEEHHSGEILVRSRPRKGTTFVVRLPLFSKIRSTSHDS